MGYNSSRTKIQQTLTGRTSGTQVTPDSHQAMAETMLNYIQEVENISVSGIEGIAYPDTEPLQPDAANIVYISAVPSNTTYTYKNFADENGDAVSITATTDSLFVILFWNKKYWSYLATTSSPHFHISAELTDQTLQEAITDAISNYKSVEVVNDLATGGTDKALSAEMGKQLSNNISTLSNKVASLESDKLTPKVVIYAPDVVEYIPNNSSISITIQLQNAEGIISKDTNYTNKHLYYNINNRGEVDVQDDNVNVEYKYDAPAQVNIEARGIANYKGVSITFPIVRKTIFAVLPSYIGYLEDYNNWNNTGTKLIKHSLNGQYNVTNPYDLAYLVIAIPKNGMVSNISSIIQKGTLDAVQQYDVIDKGNYTLYVCRTKHNKGTYTFAVS